MVVGENNRTANIMDGIENTGDVRLHDHRLRLKQRFDIVRKLGQGTYGKVQLGINKKTGQEVAIKTIKKCKIESEADLIRIRREVQIMSSVRHPNIVHIYEVFENSEKMILVMEYCPGGELYDYLSKKKVLQEDEARRLFRQIATAVYYCHIHKICHRDLKLENVLLDDTGSAKIADFGLSNVFKETSLLSTFCGSPLYASPEIVKGTPYIGPEVDCWSLGVLLYTLVYGAMPFDGSNFKRLVRQISNGDYYEPKNPSTASPLIRDMLTVDPLKRADIAYICDHSWVNAGCETSCLEVAEALAAETPVRLDLLLSLAPAAPSNSNSVVVPSESTMGPEESCTDLTSSTSMAVEPSNSAEKRILELVAEGGEDAIKPSPTRTIVSAGDNKRKLELAMSTSGLQRKKERVASCASIAPQEPLPEEASAEIPPAEDAGEEMAPPPTLMSSATITIQPTPSPAAAAPPAPSTSPPATPEIVKQPTKPDVPKEDPQTKEDVKEKTKPRVVLKKKPSPTKVLEEKASPEKLEETKEEAKPSSVAAAADKLTSLSLAQTSPTTQTPAKPKKFSIPGGNVGSFKEQFERRASLTAAPEVKRPVTKPVSKIAKPKAQSEDRELTLKAADSGATVRLQQIGIEPAPTPTEEQPNRGGVKKTESEPSHGTPAVDPSVLLQDARRSLQNSMAKLAEEKAGEESRRRAARDIISSAIRTGKPPVPYGRSSSAGVTSLSSPPASGVTSLSSPPATPPAAPAPAAPRVFRTEAHHRIEDHRNNSNRGVSVERIIPINITGEEPAAPSAPATPPAPKPAPQPRAPQHQPLRRLVSNESTTSEAGSSSGEPIKKSAREFIIPIAVEGKGYVTPRQRSLEPETTSATRLGRTHKPKRISSLVSGGESEEEDDLHMHRLRSTRAARAESVSSGEEDEEDEGFHLLTAENLFSTLLHRVRALTNRLNGEEGPGFSQHPHSLFNNLHQSPFFNSPHFPRRHLLTHRYVESKRSVSETREGWGSRDLHADFDSMFNKARTTPRGSSKKGKHRQKSERSEEAGEGRDDAGDLDLSSIQLSEREVAALSGLTPALSRRLQRQLLAHLPHLPPHAASQLRRTLSLSARATPHSAHKPPARTLSAAADVSAPAARAESARDSPPDAPPSIDSTDAEKLESDPVSAVDSGDVSAREAPKAEVLDRDMELPAPQFCTLPRPKRNKTVSRESSPPVPSAADDYVPKYNGARDATYSRASSIRSTPDRPLLSKYLTPERALSLDDSYSSDSGSILSEPSYIAAYGTPLGGVSRRHSMRLTGDQPRKRISRFLRSDFFDTPPDESIYAKHKKEKELETQKILREIREKKNRSLDNPDFKNFTDVSEESGYSRKCLSPISPLGILTGKERSRSTTPFFPILDNIKETTIDTTSTPKEPILKKYTDSLELNNRLNDDVNSKNDSQLTRPKSYPVKHQLSLDESTERLKDSNKKESVKEKYVPKESKLIRPKSYPTSSPSPEKVYVSRSIKKEERYLSPPKEVPAPSLDSKNDVEVSFSITLPKKSIKPSGLSKAKRESPEHKQDINLVDSGSKAPQSTLVLKKYQVIKSHSSEENKQENNVENGAVPVNKEAVDNSDKNPANEEVKVKTNMKKKEDVKLKTSESEEKLKSTESETAEKKVTPKKKVVKKVSSKTKTSTGTNQDGSTTETKPVTEKKKVIKKVKSVDESSKTTIAPKKKSVLQTIGHKLEKFTSAKSSSPDQVVQPKGSTANNVNKERSKLSRTQREQSVPVTTEPPSESSLIKRAATLTDVVALDIQNTLPNKTAVSKVLGGFFKKFEPKDKVAKSISEKSRGQSVEPDIIKIKTDDSLEANVEDKPKRPTSLLLNGLGKKKYGRTASDSVSVEKDDEKKETSKNLRNTLKLDFSRLPRVKKIVPTNPVIEPQIMKVTPDEKDTAKNDLGKNGILPDANNLENADSVSRSRSRSRSTYSNSELKSDNSADCKSVDINPLSPTENITHNPLRNHDNSPEKEDIVDRIRRKSFYSRFNEKKQRRRSNLVGPGAVEYDPIARIHSHSQSETKFDLSPTSPSYDLSPGFSIASDMSPSTERYRSLSNDLPISTRSNLKYDTYGLNDKIDTYRSLDRNDFRKYPSTRSYLDYDHPSSYTSHRYSRTKSLLDNADGPEDLSLSSLREPHKYNRTLSMYSPGSYATYRPKRTLNSAIILKESEKEPSPENILERIRQRKKMTTGVARSDNEKDVLTRSDVPSKGEGDSAKRTEKVD